MKFFLFFYGIIYFVYNTREMEENGKKREGRRSVPLNNRPYMVDAISGLQRR